MTAARTLIGIGLATIVTGFPASAATLRLEDATGQVGGATHIAVSLENPEEDIRALQFTVSGVPAALQLQGVEASGRAAGLTADAEQQPDNTVKVVLISLGEKTVQAGSGPVLDLNFTVGDTGGMRNVALTPIEVRVAGTDGELDATGQGGQLHVEGESTAPASGSSCAIGPPRSVPTLWPVLVVAAMLLIVRSTRFRA